MLTKIEQLWPNLSILTNFVKFDKISQLSLDFTMVWFLQKKTLQFGQLVQFISDVKIQDLKVSLELKIQYV